MAKANFIEINLRIDSLSDLACDKFWGHSDVKIDRKIPQDKNGHAVLENQQIKGFLCSTQPRCSCATTFEGKKGKTYCQSAKSNVFISGDSKILNKDGEPIKANIDDDNEDTYEKSFIMNGNVRQKKTIAVIKSPWHSYINITLLDNEEIDKDKLKEWFEKGGLKVALGTLRPDYGRFEVTEWKVSE